MFIPDEKSVVTYLCCFYKKFAVESEIEKAVKTISDALNENHSNNKAVNDYNDLATDLLDWTNKWIPWLQNKSDDHSLNDANRRLNDFRHYRLEEKPPRIENKSNLENIYDTLQTRRQLSNRPSFKPKDGQLLSDIDNAWNNLEASEKGFEDWLLSEIARLEKLDNLSQKFHQKCAFYDAWSSGKQKMLDSDEFKSSNLHSIKCLRKKHSFFESEMANHQERVEQIVAIAKELSRLQYPDQHLINRRCHEICESWKNLADSSVKRRNALAELEKLLEKIDNLHIKYASLANPFHNWVSSTNEDLLDLVIVSEISEIEQLLSDHNGFKDTIPDADSSLREIVDLDQEIQLIIRENGLDSNLLRNPYTDLTTKNMSSLWTRVQSLIPRRDSQLQREYSRQKNNDYLKQAFVEKSNQVGPWLEKQLENVIEIGLLTEDLERQIAHLNEIRSSAHEKRSQFNELEQINQQLQENSVHKIPNSKYTMESLRVGVESLLTSINKTINSFENSLIIANSKKKTDEQLNEHRRSFNHFDKDNKGLTEEQLRSFLISIGHNQDEKFKKILHKLGSTTDQSDRFDFDSIMGQLNLGNKDICIQMCDAFRVLANGKPHIKPEDLRRELSPKQAEDCLKAMDDYFDHLTGQYNFESFCKSFYSS